MSDQAWAGLFNGLGDGMRTLLALQQAAEERDRQEGERSKRDYEQGWRPESVVPRLQLPGLSLRTTPSDPVTGAMAGLRRTSPLRPDTAPVQTDVIDPVRYDTRTGVEGMVYDRQENPAARAGAAKLAAEAAEQERERQAEAAKVQALIGIGTDPALARVMAMGVRVPEAPAPRRWQPTTRDEAVAWEDEQARIRARYRVPDSPTERRDPNIVTLENQISETTRQLSPLLAILQRAESAALPSEEQQRAADAVRPRIQQLETRRDSLSAVRDRRAGAQMGTLPNMAPAPEPAPAPRDPREQQEYDRAAREYEQALSLGVDPEAAQAAHSRDLQRIARKYGALR